MEQTLMQGLSLIRRSDSWRGSGKGGDAGGLLLSGHFTMLFFCPLGGTEPAQRKLRQSGIFSDIYLGRLGKLFRLFEQFAATRLVAIQVGFISADHNKFEIIAVRNLPAGDCRVPAKLRSLRLAPLHKRARISIKFEIFRMGLEKEFKNFRMSRSSTTVKKGMKSAICRAFSWVSIAKYSLEKKY